jgi:hypothetical protein
VIVDDLDLKCVTGSKHKTDAILIVDPYAPLPGAPAREFLQSVARRNSQERDFGGRINEQQFSPCAPRDLGWDNSVALALKHLASQLARPSLDRHLAFYLGD